MCRRKTRERKEMREKDCFAMSQEQERWVAPYMYILFLLHVQDHMNRQEAEGGELIEMRNIHGIGSMETEASYKLSKALFSRHVFLLDGRDSPG